MIYFHTLSGWPGFTWDMGALAGTLAVMRHKQGRHLGKMEGMGFDVRAEAGVVTLTQEIVKSSAIEGQQLDAQQVRSSLARRLGLDAAGLPAPVREVEGIVEMMLDATQRFDQPLTAERLFGWHASLFPTGRSGIGRITVGAWRLDKHGPMQVVSGPIGRERVHFQAPDASRLDHEMRQFLAWFNKPLADMDPVLKAGVAHLWFVTIHPFDDGNGRIARAITDMALAGADGMKDRFYSMSAQIEAERQDYYIRLESAQRGSLDITAWLAWFLDCFGRAIDASDAMLAVVLRKARLWQRINAGVVNERQRLVLGRLMEPDWQGHLNTSKYAKLARCSHDTALRDIRELLGRGILARNEQGGRSTSYHLSD